MDKNGILKFLDYIETSLRYATHKRWCRGMIPTWKYGRKKAMMRLNELEGVTN